MRKATARIDRLNAATNETDGTIWWDKVAFIPSIHGKAAFARETRRVFLEGRFRTVAVELPDSLANKAVEGLGLLPQVHVVSYEEESGTRCFLPIDPCDSIIEALRLGHAENCRLEFIDMEVENFERRSVILPDPYAVHTIGLARYFNIVRRELPSVEAGSLDDERERFMATRLYDLLLGGNNSTPILCVLGILHLAGVIRYLDRLATGEMAVDAERVELLQALPPFDVSLNPVRRESLYHVLGELPYVTHLWEEQRRAITLTEFDSTDKLKNLLLVARDRFHAKHTEEYQRISTSSFQNLLQMVRNLCLIERRLTPALYEIVLAARGIGGNGFALEVIRTAKEYPATGDRPNAPERPVRTDDRPTSKGEGAAISSFAPEHDQPSFPSAVPVDVTETAMRSGSTVAPAKKRYVDEARVLKRLKLEPPPTSTDQTRWRTSWNPYETCSWEPEDRLIENFAGQVRQRALFDCGLGLERVEEFTTSFKDGLHIRETVRNAHLGKIFVREVPPVRGQVGAVVVVYEQPDPEKVPWKLTWFSEHEWESTLSFYATDYHDNLIGPGIGRGLYGGQLFLYPPRLVADIWEDAGFDDARNDAERLVFAGLFHARDKFAAYVAAAPPPQRMKTYAERLGRRLIYLPLSGFSRTTLERLRTFHVLNGKPVRGYAQQFIR